MSIRSGPAIVATLLLLAASEAEASAAEELRRPASALERGERAFAQKSYANARPELARAYARTRNTRALWLLSACDMELEDWPNAASELLEYVAAKDARRDLRGRAQKVLIPAVRRKVAELVLSLPEGAAYAIDDGSSVLVATRSRVFVTPGAHRVHILSGARDAMVTIDAAAGTSTTVLMPADDLTSPVLFAAALSADAGEQPSPSAGEPALDTAASLAPTPIAAASPSPGIVTFDPRPAPWTSTGRAPVVISLSATALAAAALGTYFAFASSGSTSRATVLRDDSLAAGRYCAGANGGGACADATDLDRRAGEERSAAIGLFAGAAAFGASALVTYLAWPSAAKGLTVGASASPRGVDASAIIRF